jgi:hypothetical protein
VEIAKLVFAMICPFIDVGVRGLRFIQSLALAHFYPDCRLQVFKEESKLTLKSLESGLKAL